MRSRREIDGLCDEFEARWTQSPGFSIEQFTQERNDVCRELIEELILLEVDLAHAAGREPERANYDERFPDHLESVAKAFVRIAAAADSSSQLLSGHSAGDALEFRDEADLPEELGGYRLIERLGGGQFGVVFHAIDIETEEHVALKFPRQASLSSVQELEQLRNEFELASKLDHDSIVRSYGICEAEGFLFIVQQFVNGKTLATRGTPPGNPEWVVSIVADLADAMGYAHQIGVVHRDLKPDNVLIDQDDRPLITDFGLSIHENFQRRMRGQVCGTPPYMSPEQVMGLTHQLDGRSDIWSLGVILYELLTGDRPFGGGTDGELFEEIKLRNEKPLLVRRPDLDRELQRICLRCLAKPIRDRYQSAEELSADLRNWLQFRGQWQAGDAAPLVPRGLAPFGADDAEAFLELLPGPRTRLGIPDSIDFWQSRIQSEDGSAGVPVGVIFGPTGSGKSSFIKAGLLPALDPRIVSTIYVEATPEDTEVRLVKALRNRFPAIPDDVSLPDMFHGLRSCCWSSGQRLLIVLDQFEQWLHQASAVESAQLMLALRHCDGPNLACVLLIRDEYWLQTSRLLDSLGFDLRERDNAQRIDRFTEPHARAVLLRLGQSLLKLPTDASELTKQQAQFLDRVITDLADNNRIASIHLSLFAEMFKEREWTLRELTKIGGVAAVGSKFLEATFDDAGSSPVHEQLAGPARTVLEMLLPDTGSNLKGHMQPVSSIRETLAADFPDVDPGKVLKLLAENLRIIVPTHADHAEPEFAESADDSELHYQLIHDYLVPAIRDWLRRNRQKSWQGRARHRLEELSDGWRHKRDGRYLPSLPTFVAMQLATWLRPRTELQKQYLRTATKFHALRSGVVAVIFVLLGFGLWNNANRADRAFRRQGITQFRKYLESPPEAAIGDLERLREYTEIYPELAARELTDSTRARIAVATMALAAPSPATADAVVHGLADADDREYRFLLSQLARNPKLSAEALRTQFSSMPRGPRRLRIAAAILYLGDTDDVRQAILADRQNPTEATLLTHQLWGLWPDPTRLLQLAQSSREDPDTLFFALTAAAGRDFKEWSTANRTRWTRLIRTQFVQNPDAGVHAACQLLARRWEIPVTLTATAQPQEGMDWWYVRVADDHCMTFVRVRPGTFVRGRNAPDNAALAKIFPEESVQVSSEYWIAQTEATCALLTRWLNVCDPPALDLSRSRRPDETIRGRLESSPSTDGVLQPSNAQIPIFCLTYTEAQALAEWLTARIALPGYSFDIPSADEWEFACRAQTTTLFHFGDNRTHPFLDRYAVRKAEYGWDADDCSFLSPVATLLPSRSGLFDTAGNTPEYAAQTDRERLIEDVERVFLKGGSLTEEGLFPPGAYRSAGRNSNFGLFGIRFILRCDVDPS